MQGGSEWLIDAAGCDPEALRSLRTLRRLCESVIEDLGLHVVADPHWHQFPGEAGVTGLYLLSESHLTCHTFPESGVAAINLFCCRPRPEWNWERELVAKLQATDVQVRRVDRDTGLATLVDSSFRETGGPR